jgi:uncharacterized membrane protein YhhN
MTAAFIFLGFFALAAVVHLGAIFVENDPARGISKVCLLPALLGLYLVTAEHLRVPVVLALLLGWAGDFFLLRINYKGFFQLGLGGFLLGHLCYILALLSFTATLNTPALIAASGAVLLLEIPIFWWIKPDRAFRIPLAAYGIIIGAMSVCALELLLYRRDGPGIAVFAGSLCFMLSDSILGYFAFRTMPRYGNFLVMVPYIAAQGLIVLGLTRC